MDDARKKGERPAQDLLDQAAELAKSRKPSCQGFALAKTAGPADDPAPAGARDQRRSEPARERVRQRRHGDGGGRRRRVDAATGKPMPSSLELHALRTGAGAAGAPPAGAGECLLPRSAAFDPAARPARRLLRRRPGRRVRRAGRQPRARRAAAVVGGRGPERHRGGSRQGPRGGVVPVRARASTSSPLGGPSWWRRRAGQAPARRPHRHGRRPAARSSPCTFALGRVLFHMVGDERISRDGRACASCHPDGRDDALRGHARRSAAQHHARGPRRPDGAVLLERIGGGFPAGAHGHRPSTAPQGDGGLKSVELEALMAYVESLTPPPSPVRAGPRSRQVAPGRAASSRPPRPPDARPATAGPATDNEKHDVKARRSADQQGEFDTPSLHFVGGTGPYFHDGRYRSLRDLLEATRDDMGHTSQLSPQDLEALAAYVRALCRGAPRLRWRGCSGGWLPWLRQALVRTRPYRPARERHSRSRPCPEVTYPGSPRRQGRRAFPPASTSRA